MLANEKQVTFLHSRMHVEFTTILYIKQKLSYNCIVIVQLRLRSQCTRVHSQKPTISGVRGQVFGRCVAKTQSEINPI